MLTRGLARTLAFFSSIELFLLKHPHLSFLCDQSRACRRERLSGRRPERVHYVALFQYMNPTSCQSESFDHWQYWWTERNILKCVIAISRNSLWIFRCLWGPSPWKIIDQEIKLSSQVGLTKWLSSLAVATSGVETFMLGIILSKDMVYVKALVMITFWMINLTRAVCFSLLKN